MSNKTLSLISLAMKAGKVKSGEFACEMAIKSKNACLIIVSSDASKNTKKKFLNLGCYYNIETVESSSKSELGRAIGKDDRAIVVILDDNFKELIVRSIK